MEALDIKSCQPRDHRGDKFSEESADSKNLELDSQCPNCREMGHGRIECPQTHGYKEKGHWGENDLKTCYNCGGTDHMTRDCTSTSR